MIVYNSTCKVRWDIAEDWLSWQVEEQIPAILKTGLFDNYQLYRLLDQDEEEGATFVIQMFTSDLERYEQFLIGFSPALQQAAWEKWGDGFIAFRTLMERVQ
ncbi:DUF4286 family protein [Puia sp.]|jgi:hypothetical protein|uniref:DUF4286 family protein n=1 Tax=Puia sp. TaxID=2045100 RepID=UPI002F3F0A3D